MFTHLAITQKRISQRQKSKSLISESIEKIRETVKKPEVIEELEKIERKVSELAEMQVRARNENELLLQRLQEKIGAVKPKPESRPFEDFERISSRLSENAIKLTRIGEAETKIESEFKEEKSEIQKVEERLALLERKFNILRTSKQAKKSDLDRIKSLIEKHKKTIKEIKKET